MSVNYVRATSFFLPMACRPLLLLSCALLASVAGAAELGEPRVSSYLGQPLVADIELTLLENAAAPVQVRLAHPNVYRGANIGMPHVLSTLNLSVMQREGRQFLHVTSRAPVEAGHLHLYLELADGSQRGVRLATLWLAPDPNPAPVPVPVSAPAKAPEPLPLAKPAVKPIPKPVPKPVAKPAVKLDRPAPAVILAPAPTPATAACAPAAQPMQPKVCAALDYKNAQLREQIGLLEDKVKVLQVAMGASPAAVSAPKPPRAKPRRKPAPEPQDETPWAWIGAGVGALLALAGGTLALKRRKKAPAQRAAAAPKLALLLRLRQRFARKKAAPRTAEPSMEEAAHDTSTQV